MEVLADALTKTLPAYLQSLPIPRNAEELTSMTPEKAVEIAPIFLILVVHFFVVQMLLCGSSSKARCNTMVKLDSPKVVDKVKPEFKDGKIVMCRCWKSKTFPYCDGSHAAHNKETGDNVGPLIILEK